MGHEVLHPVVAEDGALVRPQASQSPREHEYRHQRAERHDGSSQGDDAHRARQLVHAAQGYGQPWKMTV